METKKYIMWSDGVVSSFGRLMEKLEDGKIRVQNPVVILFTAVNEPVYETDANGNMVYDATGQPIVKLDDNKQPIMKGSLNWDMNPYVFGAVLKDSADNIWTVTPRNIISEDALFDDRLIKHYETLIKLCDKVVDGEVVNVAK